MSAGQGDSFQIERIAALSSLNRMERAASFADSRNRRRQSCPAPDDDETDSETDAEASVETADVPPDVGDIIEWSAALRESSAPPAALSPRPAPSSPALDPESRRLDLTV